MLVIRAEQMKAMAKYAREGFIGRMMAHLRRNFAQQIEDRSDEELRAFVVGGMDSARQYGVELENDVRRYLECMVTHGADFDTAPKTAWAGEILRREDLGGTQKMEQIIDYELFRTRK
jgi:hypothetical protein